MQLIKNCQFVFTASRAKQLPRSGVVVPSVPLLWGERDSSGAEAVRLAAAPGAHFRQAPQPRVLTQPRTHERDFLPHTTDPIFFKIGLLSYYLYTHTIQAIVICSGRIQERRRDQEKADGAKMNFASAELERPLKIHILLSPWVISAQLIKGVFLKNCDLFSETCRRVLKVSLLKVTSNGAL